MVPEGLRKLFEFLNHLGLMDVVLPFVIAFSLLFGIFEKTMVFGRENSGNPKSRINMMVAAVISLMFVVSLNLVNMMTYIVWIFAGLIMAVILALIIAGVFGVNFGGEKKSEKDGGKSPSATSTGGTSPSSKNTSANLTSEDQQMINSINNPGLRQQIMGDIVAHPERKDEILNRVRQAIISDMLRGGR